MKKLLTLAVAAAMTLSVAAASATTLKLSEVHAEGYPTTLADQEFARLIEEKTEGRIKVEVYSGGQLYGEETGSIEALQLGDIAFARVSASPVASYVPALNAIQMPYLYKNADHMWAVLDGEIGKDMLAQIEASGSGLVGLCWYDAGARSYYTTKKVASVADMKGLKIRMQNNAMMVDMTNVLGGTGVTGIGPNEVYSAIKQGTIDGAENNWPTYQNMGDYEAAIRDYSRAIELYPDFANAYLGRSSLRYMTNDLEGSRSDKQTAERKIAEYRSKLNDSTFSIYADTSRRFNQLLSFESEFAGNRYESLNAKTGNIALLPMFKFSLMTADTLPRPNLPGQYYVEQSEQFLRDVGDRGLRWVNRDSDLPADTLFVIDAAFVDRLRGGDDSWQAYFLRGVSQSLIRQYTSSIANYTAAIDRNPSNPFLYINRSTTQSEMIDFISSIDNGYQRITVDNDPASQLKSNSSRSYNYDDAIADLNKAARLFPEFAYIYYNRANLLCRSGRIPEALEDYTKAIELNPSFAEAYYNRGLVQIFLKDTRKGCLDMSKAGELGLQDAYRVLKLYGNMLQEE